MNNNTDNYKFTVGQRVQVREDLRVGVEYESEKSSASNYFTPDMLNQRGTVTEIVGRRHGQYILKTDRFNLYTDSMLIDLLSEEEEEFSKAEYQFNEEVEQLIAKLMEHQRLQAIDHALDSKMHETDPEGFQQLVDLKF